MSLLPALLCSSLLAALAIWKKALTRGGVVLAWALAVIIARFGGVACFAELAGTFVFSLAADKLCPTRRRQTVHREAKSGARDSSQIFCNVGTGALLLLCYGLTAHPACFYAYGAVMAESLADSMASGIGVLSRQQPYDICRRQPLPAGLSGGVTRLGFFASLLGAALNSGVFLLLSHGSWEQMMLLTLLGTVGALTDSIMGALFQAKYRCPVCGLLLEKKEHCHTATQLVSGNPRMTNDLVNLLNNLLVALLALLLFGCFPI